MEEYPEELRTPPVPLVALVGSPDLHAAISLYLHREQPPLNTLALPDFAKVPMIGGKERKPVDARMPPPLGILKADWLTKHRTRMPAVLAVLFDREQVYGDPAQWMQVCTHLDNMNIGATSTMHSKAPDTSSVSMLSRIERLGVCLNYKALNNGGDMSELGMNRAVIRGRNIKLVVAIVQPNSQGEVNEERLTSLRKRAEVDSKCCIVFVTHEPSELRRSMARLGSILGELSNTFYREEGRRVKSRIEKKTYSSLELSVRYNFKVAVYAEFRREWVVALKSYETAYSLLQEVITNTSMGLQPVQRVVEMKAVAEQLHFKISTLLLHSGLETEAVRWFREHASWYKQMLGPLEGTFLHWAWVSKQYQVFAELLQTSLATASQAPSPSASLQPAVSDRELQPAYYYHIAAVYMVQRRRAFEAALVAFEAFEETDVVDVLAGPRDEVGPPVYVGQAPRLLKRGNDNHVQSPTETEYMRHSILLEKNFHHALVAIDLLSKARDQFKLMEAGRTITLLGSLMGREYFAAKDYTSAIQMLSSVAAMYRQEGWVALLGSSLTYLRECARCLGLMKEFIEYGLELIALPSPVTIFHGYVSGSEVSPFGQQERTQVHEELMNYLRGVGEIPSEDGESSMTLTSAQPIGLEIDLVSPLRVVLSVCAAFHEQTVKPGKVTSLTLCFLTHLHLPVTFEEVEVLFNQSLCNFTIQHSKMVVEEELAEPSARGEGLSSPFDLELQPRTWKRLILAVTAEESGKLECVEVVARLGPDSTIRCQVESPGTREEIPFWKSDLGLDMPPLADPILANYGQKVIQVEEPEALVELSLEAPVPGLVGEAFPVNITIHSTGHSIQAGDLEVYFSPSGMTEGNLSSISPSTLTSPTQAELLICGDGSEGKDDFVKFTGLVEVPAVNIGDSWSTVIYVRWLEPKQVTLMATFVYQTTEEGRSEYQYRLHKSKDIDCVEPFAIQHHYMAPFRRDALLLGSLETDHTGGHVPAAALALKESSILVVTLKNTCPIPLSISRIGVREEDESKCLVRMSGCKGPPGATISQSSRTTGSSDDSGTEAESIGIRLAPEELFTQLFWVHPLVASNTLLVGTVYVRWQREVSSHSKEQLSSEVSLQQLKSRANPVYRQLQLSRIMVESPPLIITLDCPPHSVLGKPFVMSIKVQNMTSTLQEIAFAVVDSTSFIFSGAHSDTVSILPKATHCLSYRLIPISSGMQQLPRVRITSTWYSAGFQPSSLSTQLFVFPSTPTLDPVLNKQSNLDKAFSSLAIS